MDDEFAYNAPSFLDFQAITQEAEDESDSSFFGMHEEIVETDPDIPAKMTKINGDVFERELSDTESDAAFYTPRERMLSTEIESSTLHLKSKLRRSLSVGHLPLDAPQQNVEQAIEELTLEEENDQRPSSACAIFIKNRTKTVSQDHIDRLSKPKRFTSMENLNKHMTLAEAVNKFQAGTPERFRSKPSVPKINRVAPMPWGGTKGHTPNLTTMKRARPVTALSREDREKMELEEAKKFKIRAHPVNPNILKGPLKPVQVEKKQLTTVEPFKLTEVKKKEQKVASVEKCPVFKAQPLPKSLHNPFKIRPSTAPAIKPQTPNFVRRLQKTPKKGEPEKGNGSECASKPFKPMRTQPVPFSFEKRDLELQKKKEAFINKVIEEERKAREFHANPLPKNVLKPRNKSLDQLSEAGSSKSLKRSTEELETTRFKAKPATVLKIPPFIPKKDETHALEVEAFSFSTDERLEARRKLDQQMKEREAKAAEDAKRREEEIRKREEEEVARLRKEAEVKAQPIRKYKELKIRPSNKVTEPISPVFHTDRIRNKENINQ